MKRWLIRARALAGGAAILLAGANGARASSLDTLTATFTEKYCANCHNDIDREAGLDLTSMKFAPEDRTNFATWVHVHDRLRAGEMPPKKKKQPEPAELEAFVASLSKELIAFEREKAARDGRSIQRRLNRAEYENALRDILHLPLLSVKGALPEDGEAFRFNKVSTALDVSRVHMARYMAAADSAMRQAMRLRFERPPTVTKRYYARDERSLTGRFHSVIDGSPSPDRRTFPVLGTQAQPEVRTLRAPLTVGDADPATRELEAVGWVHGHYQTAFSSGWTNFVAPIAGRYRVRFSGYTLWAAPYGHRRETVGTGAAKKMIDRPPRWHQPNYDDLSPGRRDEPIIVYARTGGGNRRLGEFDLTPTAAVHELEVMLGANETLITDAARFYRSRPTGVFLGGSESYYTNPLAQRDGAPAVAFRWMEVEGPLYDAESEAGYRLLFGDLPMKRVEKGVPGVVLEVVASSPRSGRGGRGPARGSSTDAPSVGSAAPAGTFLRGTPPPQEVAVEVVSENPEADAERLLRGFMQRVYRRPVVERDVQRFLGVIAEQRKAGLGFAAAMLAGYTAVLSSPGFLFLQERPGRLDDDALAARLAFFLWNSEPDAALRSCAARGELHQPEVLRRETERLLADPKARRFAEAFLDYWLDLRKIDDTTPSNTLYPDYYLDDLLAEAALEETRLYFLDMLRRDLPARMVVDSDFTFLNEHLAAHYGVPGVAGVAMRRVTLPAGSPRGGLLTQASVLKVTANGTTTSPVLRGVWITERILGQLTPPPPSTVVAVEPDIRGAVTIREQLDKHRADKTCASCHSKIDPPGFALESFDVMGRWRDRYRAISADVLPEQGFGKNGWPFAFHYALPVDCSGQLRDGRKFGDIREFKQLLLADEPRLARNFVQQLVVYATGAPVRFADRGQVEEILRQTESGGHGLRSLIHAIVQSELFQYK